MPEDWLLEAKRVLGGSFYGDDSIQLWIRNLEPLMLFSLYYFRVSKRASILCGRGESHDVFAIMLYSIVWLFLQCGMPVQELTCNVCGERIHTLRHDSRIARR